MDMVPKYARCVACYACGHKIRMRRAVTGDHRLHIAHTSSYHVMHGVTCNGHKPRKFTSALCKL